VLTRGADQVNRDRSYLAGFDRALSAALARHGEVIVSGTAEELLGAEWAEQLGWTDCTLVRLLGPAGELMGVLCLADRKKVSAETDQQLLEAVAGHASVALENARLFSRMDQANRHWIEIFDAISDFIVAHDGAGKVLRVNRSLADFIGVQPSELIGLNMSALLVTGNDAASGFCPYCRSTGDGTDEYVHPMLERTFLVSSSRVHGSASEVLQTIHVLKDITDRREAERRYRELFDNIQEGLFFSTPEGHFVEVNEALVRMLGYDNREELLHADVRTAVYSSAERHAEISELHAAARGAAQSRGDPAPQGRFGGACFDQRLFGARRQQSHRAVPRPHARYQRPQDVPVRAAAGARFLEQDSEQHPEFDPGGRYRGTGQLRQPPLVRHGI
jgi:PAS domain S-box-containing protein